ncbi:MAG: hypothetical protein GY729_08340 [Desulfobacteraceae bacterium]|nr:hypothetical protein [Desulfobacteraceae bacterium]
MKRRLPSYILHLMKKELEKYIGQHVVLDTHSSWIYVGILEKVTDNCVVLSDVDVHDSKDTITSKELYVYESKITGIRSNRRSVHVNMNYLVSFSLLKDIKEF